jgi:hypothetical protein
MTEEGMDQAERKLFAQRERARTAEAARVAREDLRRRLLEHPVYEMEDPVAKWKRESDEQDARFAAERQRVKDEERREREQSAVADMKAELAEALEGIATALGVLDERLKKIEERQRAKKTAARQPSKPPDFVGPTHAPDDPTKRYSQPRIQ